MFEHRHATRAFVSVLAWCAIVAPNAWAVEVRSLTDPEPLTGPWAVRSGDSPDRSSPGFDETDWERVADLRRTPRQAPEASVRWYRTTVYLSAEARAQAERDGIALAFGVLRGAAEVWVDGAQVGTFGDATTLHLSLPRAVTLPTGAGARPFVLALRVVESAGTERRFASAFVGGAPSLCVPPVARLLAQIADEDHRQREVWPHAMLGATALLFALWFGWLRVRRRELRGYFWFAGLCVLVAAWSGVAMLCYLGALELNAGHRALVALSRLVVPATNAFVFALLLGCATRGPWLAPQLVLLLAAAAPFVPGAVGTGAADLVLLDVVVTMGLLAVSGWAVAVSWKDRPESKVVAVVVACAIVLSLLHELDAMGVTDASGLPVPVVMLSVATLTLGLSAAFGVAFKRLLGDQVDQLNLTRRFVPSEAFNLLGKPSLRDVRRGDRREFEATVLHIEIQDFASWAQHLGPGGTFALVDEFVSAAAVPISGHNGVVVGSLSDGLTAIFAQPPEAAVDAAIGVVRVLQTITVARAARGETQLVVHMGLHTDPIAVGSIGVASHFECVALGEAIESARRVQRIGRRHLATIVLSGKTHAKLTDAKKHSLRLVDRTTPKGQSDPLDLYELLDAEPTRPRELKLANAKPLADAIEDVGAGKLQKALDRLRAAHAAYEDDGSVSSWLGRLEPAKAGPSRATD